MSRHSLSTCLAAAALLLNGVASSLAADGTSSWQLGLTVGGRSSDISGERNSKAEEYRDLGDGATLDDLDFSLVDPTSPWSFSLSGDNLLRDDEEATLAWSRAGRFRLDATWSRTPHFLSRGATSLWNGPQGDLQLADGLQNQIESFFTAATAPTTDQARAFMLGILAQQGRKIDLRTKRNVAALSAGIDLTPHWLLSVDARQEQRSGQSRIGTGTYIRRQTAGSFDRNRFEPRTAELPMPIDSKSEDWGLGTGFHQRNWFLDLGWEESSFTNNAGTLRWDNPFEGLPGATSSLTGLNPAFEQEPSGATANSGNRGRFATAQLDLYPSNDFERVHAAGGVSLPARTRLNVSYASSRTRQNDAFLPYTLNPAVIYANGTDGVGGTADDILAVNVPLPRTSLDGEIKTERLDLRVSSRPFDALSLRGSYRIYDYEDDSPSILFPGFASAGDAYFRPGIGQRDAAGTRVLFNEPGGYTRTAWTVGGAWRFGEPATFDLEYTDTEWEYDERQVESTGEAQLAARLRLAFGERFEARLLYLDASRDFDGAYNVGFETSRLRAFDVWERDRTRYGLELGILLGENSSLAFVYSNARDEYPSVVPIPDPAPAANPFPSLPYGLNESNNESTSVSYSIGEDRWSFSATLGLDQSEWTSMAVAKTSLGGDSPQFDPVNRWVRTQDDDVLWAALSFDTKVGSRGKLALDVDYHDYGGSYRTTNPSTPNVNDGVAYAVPDFSSSLLSGELTFEWALAEHFDIGFAYLYEPYRLDDWQWDLVQPYMQGVLKETGAAAGSLRDNTAFRTLFLDATYSDYTANVATVFLKIRY